MIPSAPAIVRPPTIAGQAGRDHAAEDEEQHHRHQRYREHFPALLVFADGSREFVGEWLQTGEFDVDTVDREVVLDLLEVVQDGVVVVALELDRHERVLFIRVGHVRPARRGS